MELHQVRYLLAVCETLNFTRAAEQCHVSQPALSRAIQQLEAELGGELFRRERRLTHITDLGRAVLPALRQCYESSLSAGELARSYRPPFPTPSATCPSKDYILGVARNRLNAATAGLSPDG